MVRDAQHGAAIAVEVWELPSSQVGSFLAGIPAPLGLGKVELEDGRWLTGFICEDYGLQGGAGDHGLRRLARVAGSRNVKED